MIDQNLFPPGFRFNAVTNQTLKSKFASYFAHEYNIIEHSVIDGTPMRPEEGAGWAINIVHAGFICEFASQAIDSARNPFPLTFITYPDSVDWIELRQEKRHPVEIEAKFYLEVEELGPENWPDGTIKDISPGDGQIVARAPLITEMNMHLSMILPDQGEICNMTVNVRDSEKIGDNYLSGLSFSDYSTDGCNKWDDCLAREEPWFGKSEIGPETGNFQNKEWELREKWSPV